MDKLKEPVILRRYFSILRTTILFFLAVSSLPLFANPTNSPNLATQCASCHQPQYRAWLTSHHEKAMQIVNKKTVLGDFDNKVFMRDDERIIFYKKAGGYFIRIESSIKQDPIKNSKNNEKTEKKEQRKSDQVYRVLYTFGFTPLQQYLVDFGKGKLQAFPIAWDSLKKEWIDLYPKYSENDTGTLDWKNHFFSWNQNCAVCHSTGIKKNYNPKSKTYHTTWTAINVSCSACHGKGAQHIKWAKEHNKEYNNGAIKSSETKRLTMINDDKLSSHQKVNQCAYCHSRHHAISLQYQPGKPLWDQMIPELLRPGLYHPDGQINDEVFVYGSFLQSKMYRAGVTCTDCHDPHALRLKFKDNALCTQCHSPKGNIRFPQLKAKNYNSPAHHHHPLGSKGAECVSCHMPGKYYMKVDYRRDHSFSIPNPFLTQAIGVPNACSQCHKDKKLKWVIKYYKKWYGDKSQFKTKSFAKIFYDAVKQREKGNREDPIRPQTEVALIQLVQNQSQAVIVRATALYWLRQYRTSISFKTQIGALSNKNPLLRITALAGFDDLPNKVLEDKVLPLLDDPILAVRMEAVRLLSKLPLNEIPENKKKSFEVNLKKHIAFNKSQLDLPGSYFNLATIFVKQKSHQQAIQAYQNAIALNKHFISAQANLAILFSSLGKGQKSQALLEKAIKANPTSGRLYYLLGLSFAEKRDFKQAIDALGHAAKYAPNNVKILYNYALALQHNGKLHRASEYLVKAHGLQPRNITTLYALTVNFIQQKNWKEALQYALLLQQRLPHAAKIQQMIRYIRINLQP